MHDQSDILKKLSSLENSGHNITNKSGLTGSNTRARKILDISLALMFPVSFSSEEKTQLCLLQELKDQLKAIILLNPDNCSETIKFIDVLPDIKEKLIQDAYAIYAGDPAARSYEEVIICYPGFFAIAAYRISNYLNSAGLHLLARCISEIAHRETGIDIHPGASIGRRFCIDHGTGIVIGETTVIGNDVKLYHGVTLGGLSVKKELATQKRHPTIEDEVTIYSNAVILGGNTVIGKGTIIGGNVWLTHSVEPDCIVDQEKQQLNIRKRRQTEDR